MLAKSSKDKKHTQDVHVLIILNKKMPIKYYSKFDIFFFRKILLSDVNKSKCIDFKGHFHLIYESRKKLRLST